MSNKIRKAHKKRKKEKKNRKKRVPFKVKIETLDCRNAEFRQIVDSNLRYVLANLDKFLDVSDVKVIRCWCLLGIMGRKWSKSPNFNFELASDYLRQVESLFQSTFASLWKKRFKNISEEDMERRIDIMQEVLVPNVIRNLGEAVYNRISIESRKKYFPQNMFQLRFDTTDSNSIIVEFTSTDFISTDLGKLYFSDSSITDNQITVNRVPATLAFTSHAYHRIVQRVLLGTVPKSHYDVYLLHSILSGKTFFKSVLEKDKCRLESYFLTYANDFVAQVSESLGISKSEIDLCSYNKIIVKTGHLPLDFYKDESEGGRYWVAKTFLTPGMRNTPEAKAYESLDASFARKVSNGLDDMTVNNLSFLVWLHQRGTPCFYEFTGDFNAPVGNPIDFPIDEIRKIEDPTVLFKQ